MSFVLSLVIRPNPMTSLYSLHKVRIQASRWRHGVGSICNGRVGGKGLEGWGFRTKGYEGWGLWGRGQDRRLVGGWDIGGKKVTATIKKV